MRPNPLRKLLDEGKPSIGTHTMVFWPGMVEIIGHTGIIDYVEFVAEYAPYDLEGLENFGRAVDLFDHMTAMIKLDQEPRTFAATRAIGSGIQNVLFADVHDAEETRECVGAVRAETPQTGGHHGSGDRRFAGYILESGSPQYVQALEDSVVALMIEKKEAVDNLDEILSVPGIDMVVWGGSDYSMSIGKPGAARDPDVLATRDYVHKKALEMGIQPRAEISDPEHRKARHFHRQGSADLVPSAPDPTTYSTGEPPQLPWRWRTSRSSERFDDHLQEWLEPGVVRSCR